AASAANGLLLADESAPIKPLLGEPPGFFGTSLNGPKPSVIEQPAIAAVEYDFFVYLPTVDSALLCASAKQEEEIASLARSHPGQGRPTMDCHPILAQVARERALDMGVRDYFSHVNPDGYGPNYLVRQAGYELPSWWGTDPELNNIESIAAGYQTAADAWNGWLNSPAHRRHVLGEIDFFAEQTNYGIGYAFVPGSKYGHYWVFISAPSEE
ncbi:MAG: hypothetical protein JSW55_09940, partial [Chloroflexota bacterium]